MVLCAGASGVSRKHKPVVAALKTAYSCCDVQEIVEEEHYVCPPVLIIIMETENRQKTLCTIDESTGDIYL
jgi:hypothetical protein